MKPLAEISNKDMSSCSPEENFVDSDKEIQVLCITQKELIQHKDNLMIFLGGRDIDNRQFLMNSLEKTCIIWLGPPIQINNCAYIISI